MSDKYALANNKAIWSNKLAKDGWTHSKTSLHMTMGELDDLADEVLKWAKESDAIKAHMFPIQMGVSTILFKEWVDKCPRLEEAYNEAKLIIGERRERKGLKGEFNATIVMGTMALYDKEYAAWRKEMNAKSDAGSQQTVIVLRDKMPETEIVKERVYEGTE